LLTRLLRLTARVGVVDTTTDLQCDAAEHLFRTTQPSLCCAQQVHQINTSLSILYKVINP
jgi:hypothetical protein